ncbi:ABC transporter ATP-binding protein [Streptomyces albidoflavus]
MNTALADTRTGTPQGTTTATGLTTHGLAVGHRLRRATRAPDGNGPRRRHRTVLAGLDLTARAGELTVLLGPNGAGKSTLLRTLCGLLPPLAGEVRLDSVPLTGRRPADLARHLAVVLTDRVDGGLLTARELTALGRHPHTGLTGRLTEADHAAVAWALEAVGATALAERPAAELSDGERQRVLTARALAQEPGVVLLDEPTAFLDVPSRVALTVLLRDLARSKGLTVVVSTHDLELALRVADAVWLVGRDARVDSGAPEDLVRAGAVAAAFDADHLAFDPATGTFGLRRAHRGTLTVDAPPGLRPLLARALAREGYATAFGTAGEAGPDTLGTVTARPDGTFLTRRGTGPAASAGSFHSLTQEVRTW